MPDGLDGDTLEPLPVFDDAGRHDPVAARPAPTANDVRHRTREVLEALRAVVDDRALVRSQSPWTPAPSAAAPARPARWATTFSRMIALHPSQLPDLPNWWEVNARDGSVRVTRRLSLEEPRPAPRGAWRARGRLRSRWLLRSIPVELLLWPHLGAWTKLSLEPQRAVLAGRPYFRKGHRVLDVLTNRLRHELRSG